MYNKPVIVAVDDQPSVLNTVVSILKPLYQVRPLISGGAVLEYVKTQSADLILLDYQMPGISGAEVMEHLRQNEKTRPIPVVFLTGSEDGGAEVEVLEKGAADYIHKPVKEQVLLARIHIQLELARYRNHMEALVEEKTQKLRAREDIALNLLAEATDMRDHNTGGHINRTTEIVRILVAELLENPTSEYWISSQDAEDIVKSSKLHDIGKIAIPDEVLLKPGRLTAGEFETIKGHPGAGARLLDKYDTEMGNDSFLNTSRDIALYHHEKWNGTGYPCGLSGADIPLSARITALADVYDALISVRPYKEPFTHERALEIIRSESGEHFDPYLVSVFEKNSAKIKAVGVCS